MFTEEDLPRFELDGERFVRPDFAGRGLANVAPTVLELLAPGAVDGIELPALDTTVLPAQLTRGWRTDSAICSCSARSRLGTPRTWAS